MSSTSKLTQPLQPGTLFTRTRSHLPVISLLEYEKAVTQARV